MAGLTNSADFGKIVNANSLFLLRFLLLPSLPSLLEDFKQALIDSNPLHQGKIVLGYPINIPEKLAEDKFSGTILITTSLYADEVADQIQNLGLSCHVKKMSP